MICALFVTYFRKKPQSKAYTVLKTKLDVICLSLLKRFLPQLVIVITVSLISSLGYVKQGVKAAQGEVTLKKTVIIDAGHGEFDGGAVSVDGTSEKDINLIIAKKVADSLTLLGYEVYMTREDDTALDEDKESKIQTRKKSDMQKRLSLINSGDYDICVSIHLNKFTTSVPNGAQVFYGVKNENSKPLAEAIQKSIKEKIQSYNERVVKKGTKQTYLLYNATIPMVIVECGFISNTEELARLKSNEYQTKIALCIAGGINDYFYSL